MAVDVACVAVTAVLGLAGLLVGLSWYRDQQLKIAEERLSAYRSLWEVMKAASPMRMDKGGEGPLTRTQAAGLDRKLGSWYYDDGHGLLLTLSTTDVYLAVRNRLRKYARNSSKSVPPARSLGDADRPWEQRRDESPEAFDAFRAYLALSPERRAKALNDLNSRWACEWSWDDRASEWDEGKRRLRELSLLRTQMKLDVKVIGHSYWRQDRTPDDKEFLADANIDINLWAREPWYRRHARRKGPPATKPIRDLQRFNDETFQAEAKHEVGGMTWDAYLRKMLTKDFVLRRSRTDVRDETREEMITRIRETNHPVERMVLPESVQVWASDTLGVVKCIVTIPRETGGIDAFQNVKVFKARASGDWNCVYWQVSARPIGNDG